MASREELLVSIQPGMKLTKNFFMRIYGYELTWPGFADQALTELEKAGCSSARTYYQSIVSEYEEKHEEVMKNVSRWINEQGIKRKGSDGLRRKQREAEQVQHQSAKWMEGMF